MKSKILLFEGYDGSGKSTLIDNYVNFLKRNGKSVFLVGRDLNTGINYLTKIIRDKDLIIDPTTEILVRLARENERIAILKEERFRHDYIIFDRSLLSAISWIKYYHQSFSKYEPLISYVFKDYGVCFLIYLTISE